jgi:putative peptidoglycan binding protein
VPHQRTFRLVALGASLAALIIGPGYGHAHAHSSARTTPFVYTTPANVLRGQAALERLGFLKRVDYAPGEINEATREALRDYQRAHSLRQTGMLDWDTFALLPIDERPDKDDDGVPDAVDACPGSMKGARVGHDGCPLAGP